MIFSCDLDGVIADVGPELHRRISLNFGVPLDQVRKDKYWMFERFNIEPKVMNTFVDAVLSDVYFWEQVEPIWHNIKALREIDTDHRIVFITGRHKEVRDVTEAWLTNVCQINYHTLLMHSLAVKHRAMKYCGAEFMIEDRYSEAVTIANKGFRSYLIRTEYNMDYAHADDNPELLFFVNTVQEVLDLEGLYGR